MRIKANSWSLLLALSGAGVTMAPALAQDKPAAETVSVVTDDEAPAIVLDFPEPDWTLLDSSASPNEKLTPKRAAPRSNPEPGASWSSHDKPNGTAALSVKQPLSPFWDARIGADMSVVNQSSTMTTSDLLRQKYSTNGQPSQSSGTAWAAVTAPGVGSIWDKTSIEARVDPAQVQSKLGTSLSKSLPLWTEHYSLTLQNGYNVTQQSLAPTIGFNGRPTRNYETDQSAKLSIVDTGTSFIAGQSLSSTDDKWLRKVGAEQKLFGDVNISASVSETLQGPANKSLSAGFKRSW